MPNCCERSEQHPILAAILAVSISVCVGRIFSESLMSLAFVLLASLFVVERHSVRDNVRFLTIKTVCFAVAHFGCVVNLTFYLVNITLYCFVTVSLKELFGLLFQSVVDFKSCETRERHQKPYKPICGSCDEQTELSECDRWPMCRTTHCGRKHFNTSTNLEKANSFKLIITTHITPALIPINRLNMNVLKLLNALFHARTEFK